MPLCYCRPDGGYFIFAGFSSLEADSHDCAENLIKQHGLFTTPGADYGPAGEGFLTIVYVALNEEEIDEAGRVLSSAVAKYLDSGANRCARAWSD